MRTLRLSFAAAVAVLIASSASAELIIYKGTLKQSAVGQGVSRTIISKFYLIVDHDTANIAEIQYTTVNGSKIFATHTETNLQFVQISSPKGKSNEAIAHPPTDCEISEGVTSDGIFVEGADSLLAVNTNSTITFPKLLSGGGRYISYSAGPPMDILNTLVVGFDGTQTPISNGNGETLDAALTRLSNIIAGQGYTQQSEKAQNSERPLELLNSFR